MTRTTVKATHLGKVIVWPVEDITHFESSYKYTIAHRSDGKELLLTDAMKSLAEELAERFIMVRRGMLVARHLLVSMRADPDGSAGYVSMLGLENELPCGRSYMKSVRRYLKSRSAMQ